MDKKYIDVEYQDINRIKGSDNIRYNATQVSDMYDIPVSKVRYYMKAFEGILDLDYSNRMRRFSKDSLRKFDYLVKLKNDGMTVQQILDYCENKEVFSEESLNTPNNPLTVEMLAKAISVQVEALMNDFKGQIISEVVSSINESNQIFKEDIITTIDEVVSEKLEAVNSINDNILNIKEDILDKDNNLDKHLADIKEDMDHIKQQQAEMKSAYLTFEQVVSHEYNNKSWLEKLIMRFK